MKILVLPNRGRSYNAVRPEAECYISLAKKGHDITIMTELNNAYWDEYKKANIKVIELKSNKKYSLAVMKQVRTYIKSNKIDIVYATTSYTIANAAFGCIGTKAKMVAYRGTSGGMYKTDPTNYLSMLHPRINGVICVSTPVTTNVKSKVRAAIKKNVITIYKGHELNWYHDEAANLENLGSTIEHFNVLCVGSPRPHKGTSVLLDATKQLSHLDNLKIILVGDNLETPEYLEKITHSGMAERIILTGFRTDVPAIAKACDILVLPSLSKEGLTRTVLESLANGTPVVSSANDGVLESIEDGVNGLIVPIGDVQALAEKIQLLYQDKTLLTKLANNATSVITGKMSHNKTVEAMSNYFEKLITH